MSPPTPADRRPSRCPGSARSATTTTSSSASPTRRSPARTSTAATSCSPPTATASTTCCCRRATRSASTTPRSPRRWRRMTSLRMLLAVRCGELVVPQLARQLATLDQMLGGRLTVNIISSDVPGEELASGPRYRRSTEIMYALRELLDGHAVKFHGDFVDLEIDPPRAAHRQRPQPAVLLRRALAGRPRVRRRRRRRLPDVARRDGVDARGQGRHGRARRGQGPHACATAGART